MRMEMWKRAGSSLGRKLGALLLAAGLVGGALAAGAGGEGMAQAAAPSRYWTPEEMPEYPGGLEFPLGNGMALNGVALRVSYFEAKASPDRIRDFYVTELEHRGLLPQARPGAGRGWTVTALTEDASAQVVVAILERGRAGSWVFPSIVPLDADPAPTDVKSRLPASEHAAAILETTSADAPRESVVTYQEPRQSAVDCASHIRSEMARRGFEVSVVETTAGELLSQVIEATHDSQHARFTVTGWPRAKVGAAVTVHLFEAE